MVAIPIFSIGLLFLAQPSCACSSPPPSPDPTSPVEGIVVGVNATSLSDVQGFTLRTSSGSVVELKLGALENPTDFPPGHLAEHQATSSPIRAFFRVESGVRLVYRLEDARSARGL